MTHKQNPKAVNHPTAPRATISHMQVGGQASKPFKAIDVEDANPMKRWQAAGEGED